MNEDSRFQEEDSRDSVRVFLGGLKQHLEAKGERVLALSLVSQVALALAQRGPGYVVYRSDDGMHLNECYLMPEMDRAWREYSRIAAEVAPLREIALGNRERSEGGAV